MNVSFLSILKSVLKAETKRQETSRTVFVVALAGYGLLPSKKYHDK